MLCDWHSSFQQIPHGFNWYATLPSRWSAARRKNLVFKRVRVPALLWLEKEKEVRNWMWLTRFWKKDVIHENWWYDQHVKRMMRENKLGVFHPDIGSSVKVHVWLIKRKECFRTWKTVGIYKTFSNWSHRTVLYTDHNRKANSICPDLLVTHDEEYDLNTAYVWTPGYVEQIDVPKSLAVKIEKYGVCFCNGLA